MIIVTFQVKNQEEKRNFFVKAILLVNFPINIIFLSNIKMYLL